MFLKAVLFKTCISAEILYFNLFVSIFMQSYANIKLHVSTLYRYLNVKDHKAQMDDLCLEVLLVAMVTACGYVYHHMLFYSAMIFKAKPLFVSKDMLNILIYTLRHHRRSWHGPPPFF
jgi:hypothetical protein